MDGNFAKEINWLAVIARTAGLSDAQRRSLRAFAGSLSAVKSLHVNYPSRVEPLERAIERVRKPKKRREPLYGPDGRRICPLCKRHTPHLSKEDQRYHMYRMVGRKGHLKWTVLYGKNPEFQAARGKKRRDCATRKRIAHFRDVAPRVADLLGPQKVWEICETYPKNENSKQFRRWVALHYLGQAGKTGPGRFKPVAPDQTVWAKRLRTGGSGGPS